MRFLRQGLLGLFLLSVTVGLLAYAGQTLRLALEERAGREAPVPERQERVLAVRTIRAEAATVTPTLTAFGRIESRRTLEIRAQATGVITELAPGFVEGGAVTAGQLLARIDPADAEIALARARTDLGDARAEERAAARALDLARDELAAREEQAEIQTRALARQRDLESRGVGTLTAIEAAEFNLVQARQAVLAARQSLTAAETRVDQAASARARAGLALSEAERRLAETRITAGFAGRLSEVSVVAGRLVSANEQLARLVDPRALDVAFRVSNAQYPQLLDVTGALRPAPVTVMLDSGSERITATGHIAREAATLAEGESGRMIFAALDDAPVMKPGDFVTVTVDEPPLAGVARLPASALGPDGSVLAIGAQDRLERLPITLLRRQGNEVLLRGAEVAGREIVTEHSPALVPGLKVRRLAPEAAASAADEGAAPRTAGNRAQPAGG
ncbi:MAG: HlyD family efflux transporter periplasmic adaptor subunit [Roseovarius sp.]|nr:HlyD family efflux transporter periplasmic adaptor subunit [Roseovarius sp.]